MYNKQEMVDRIKKMLKKRNITQAKMLSDCGMGKNTLARLTEKSDGEDANERDILLQNFVKIADYLNCSADFLLARSDAEQINKSCENADGICGFDDALQEQQLEFLNYGAAAESAVHISPQTPDADTVTEIAKDFN